MSDETIVQVESSVGARHRRPAVTLTVGDADPLNLPARDALRIGFQLVAAAHNAISDVSAIGALGGERLTNEDCAVLLIKLRQERDAIDEREGTGSL